MKEILGTLDLIRPLDNREITRENAQEEVEKFWMGALRRAVQEGDVDHGSLMAGQSVGVVHGRSTVNQIVRDVVDETEAELWRVKSMLCP